MAFTLSNYLKRGIDAGHHLMKFILAGNCLKLASVQAIDPDIQRGETGVAPGGDIARQAITVSGNRHGANSGIGAHAAMISVKSRRSEGSPPVRRTLSVPSAAKDRVTRRI